MPEIKIESKEDPLGAFLSLIFVVFSPPLLTLMVVDTIFINPLIYSSLISLVYLLVLCVAFAMMLPAIIRRYKLYESVQKNIVKIWKFLLGETTIVITPIEVKDKRFESKKKLFLVFVEFSFHGDMRTLLSTYGIRKADVNRRFSGLWEGYQIYATFSEEPKQGFMELKYV